MKIALATIAQYFRIGLEADCCRDDEVREWALRVIEALDDPPAEIFELSWRYPRSRLLDNLNAVQGAADLDAVGDWLLAAIDASMTPDGNLHHYLRQAFYVVRATNLSRDDVYFTLDCIADDLQLTELGLAGEAAACRQELSALLSRYSPAPFAQGWADVIFAVTGSP
ncbi:MAG TPA: hypothetical protein VGA09_14785 [Candidatus Binatia bacterium]